MPLQQYRRFSFLWGAVDLTEGDPPYHADEVTSLGPDAREGSGVGVRRASLVISRLSPTTFGEDVAVMHFDWLNFTSGAPDDSWTTSDFSLVEANIQTWWQAMQPYVSTRYTYKEVRWYRIGTGVTPPNPPVRVLQVGIAGTATSKPLPPQCACSISFHVAPRRNWGRTYLPGLVDGTLDTDGTFTSVFVNAVQAATVQLVNNMASVDTALVVMSKTRAAALNVEAIAVDDICDVIRRRRWDQPALRVITPTPTAMAHPAGEGKGRKGSSDENGDEADEFPVENPLVD